MSVSKALTLAALSVTLGACSRTLDMPALHQSISGGLNTQLAMPIASVTCGPEDRQMKAGEVFECTAIPQAGGRLTITVTQKDDTGNVTWEVTKTEGLLDLDIVEASVRDGLKAQAQVDATIDCGGRWRLAKPGEAFTCQATMADGRTATVSVTTAEEGNISWKIE